MTFPDGFLWGAGTSAYQIEGSLDADGRGTSVWDTFAARPGAIEGGGDGSRACDSYRRWPEDIDLLAEMGLGAYRFSVAWSRIVPDGRGRIEERGLDHYERFVDALLARGIEPILTLNHWDMPQALMADGGWAGRSSVTAFAEFTTAVAGRLGDRVTWWITQNEPWIIQLLGYRLGLHAPGVRDLGASVAAGHHVLLAHGAGADILRSYPGVQAGVALNLLPCVPATSDPADVQAAWASDGYCNRWFLDPLFGRGYPDDMREHYERALGRTLDEIRPGDEEAIAGRNDFLGVNYYTRRVMAAAEPDGPEQPFPWRVVGPSGDVARTDEGTEIAPEAFRDLLIRLHDEYDGVPVIVTENGGVFGDTPTHDGHVHDVRRQDFLRAHVTAMGEAMRAGADVRGYLHWSLLDNFEWALGYRPRFGLVHVDYVTGSRTIKDSGRLYARIARNSSSADVAVRHEPDGIVVTTASYRLDVDAQRPRAVLRDPGEDGREWSRLSLLASLDLVDGRDESAGIQPARVVAESPDAVELLVEAASSVWSHKAVRVRCTAKTVELWAVASGAGVGRRLSEVTLLGGRAVLPSGAAGTFRSSIGFASLFSPAPTEPVHVVRPASAPSVLGVVGDAEPGRLNGIFSPPPLCWALGDVASTGATDVPDASWWGLSVCAPVDELTMTGVRYDPLDGGFVLRLDYEGHTRVAAGDGAVSTPRVVLRPAGSPWEALSDHHDDLVGRGWAPPPADPSVHPAWWSEPLFCGWGAQCSRAASAGAGGAAVAAPDLARQDVYDEFLDTLAGADLDPGTIVVDDRWQAAYGTAEPDAGKWPDLRRWIAGQHAAGHRVLLWWKAWDPGGLPVDECVTDVGGRPVAVDVANPAYRDRLSRIVAGLLGPDGLDADGFKVDFTQRAPSGESLRAHDGPWGIAALHTLLETMNSAAKAVKPDALVITHTPHPSFGDVCDMVRLNDVLERDVDGRAVSVVEQLRFRHAVAEHSLPGHVIDTDQWPMPDRASWRDYVEAQAELGTAVPALYYLESIDNSGERLSADDLALVARSWAAYRMRVSR